MQICGIYDVISLFVIRQIYDYIISFQLYGMQVPLEKTVAAIVCWRKEQLIFQIILELNLQIFLKDEDTDLSLTCKFRLIFVLNLATKDVCT